MTQPVLQLIDIKKSFAQGTAFVYAVKSANLQIVRGEVAALSGPSGSGKTTLLQIAGLLDSPDHGQILIEGQDLSKADDEARTNARKNSIGFIYQFHHLLPEFSALENVALPLLIKDVNKSEAFDRAQEVLKLVGLASRLNHKSAELSGGEQQRVGVARAVVARPALILADEPTGNLDSAAALTIFELLMSVAKFYQVGCLVVTHNMELAKKTDRILLIRDGEVS